MAKAIPVTLCHGCKKELPTPIPKICPGCGRVLEKASNPSFSPVDYFVLQLEEHREESLQTSQEKHPSKEDRKKIAEVEKDWVDWLRGCAFEDKLMALQDADALMQHLIYGRHSIDELRALTALGKKIGNQSEAIEKFFAAGGQLYDREAGRIPPQQGDTPSSKEAVSK